MILPVPCRYNRGEGRNSRVLLGKSLGNEEIEDGVPQELEPLVAGTAILPGGVGARLDQQAPVFELVLQQPLHLTGTSTLGGSDICFQSSSFPSHNAGFALGHFPKRPPACWHSQITPVSHDETEVSDFNAACLLLACLTQPLKPCSLALWGHF
jgi:hypothetical protein